MAFKLKVEGSYEYRGVVSGVSAKTGNPWMSLKFEDEEAEQFQVSVPLDMQGDVYNLGLRRGTYYIVLLRAVATADGNNYLQLLALPELDEDEEG